jgi:hypothetical protein
VQYKMRGAERVDLCCVVWWLCLCLLQTYAPSVIRHMVKCRYRCTSCKHMCSSANCLLHVSHYSNDVVLSVSSLC